MQMVQGLVIAAQALHTGPEGKQAAAPAAPPPAAAGMGTAWPDRAERLAGSLAKLCLTLQGLNALQHGMQVGVLESFTFVWEQSGQKATYSLPFTISSSLLNPSEQGVFICLGVQKGQEVCS